MATKIKTPVEPIKLPRTMADVVGERQASLRDLQAQLVALTDKVKKIVHEQFVLNGGCDRCHGRGWIVVWDTLDCMDGSCADIGACPNEGCTPETRARSGLDSTYSRYDSNRGVPNPVKTSPLWALVGRPFEELVDGLKDEVRGLELMARPVKGSTVVVIKGRKVGLGTLGRVAFVHENGGVLIKDPHVWEDRKANGTWVDAKNVAVLAKEGL